MAQHSVAETKRQELLSRLLAGNPKDASAAAQEVIEHQEVSGPVPASPIQESLWFLEQLGLDNAPYNMGLAFRLPPPVSLSRLQSAIDVLVKRHAALRTSFQIVDGQPHQAVNDDLVILVEQRPWPEDERGRRDALRDDLARPFSLEEGPLFRCTLWQSAQESIVELELHHTVGDGASLDLLVQELLKLLDGISLADPPLVTPADVAVWQKRRLLGGLADRQLAFWRQQLPGDNAPLLLGPVPEQIPDQVEDPSYIADFVLSGASTTEIAALARTLRCSPFAVVLASLQVALYLATGRQDLSVGTAVDQRSRWRLGPVIGCFVNTVVLYDLFDPSQSFRDLVLRAARTINEAFNHAEVPFESVVAEVAPSRRQANPLCNVYLVSQQVMPGEPAQYQADYVEIGATGAQFDLNCHWTTLEGSTRVTVVANPKTIDARRCKMFTTLWKRLLVRALASPHISLDELQLAGDGDTIVPPEGFVSEQGPELTLPSLCHQPSFPAMCSDNRQLSRAHVFSQAQVWASRFVNCEATHGAPVQIMSRDVGEVFSVIWGAWLAGRAVEIRDSDAVAGISLSKQHWSAGTLDVEMPVVTTCHNRINPDDAAWVWADGSVLTHRDLASAIRDTEAYLSRHLGRLPGPVTLGGPLGPLGMLGLWPGHWLESPRPGMRPEFVIARAADLVAMPVPPRVALVPGQLSPTLGRWAERHDVRLFSAVLVPGVGVILSDRAGEVGQLSRGSLRAATQSGAGLPDGCHGWLWATEGHSSRRLPWRVVAAASTGRPTLLWAEPQPVEWPIVDASAVEALLGTRVERCETAEGVIEYAARASEAQIASASASLGLWRDTVRPLTALGNEDQAVVDQVLIGRARSELSDILSGAGANAPVLLTPSEDGGDYRVAVLPGSAELSILEGPAAADAALFSTVFRRVCQVYGERISVIDPEADPESGDHQVTYRDLFMRVQDQAARLAAHGVTKGSVVAVQGGPDLVTLVTLLAVMMLGAAYCPLDRTHPRARREQVVSVLRPVLIVTDTAEEQWGVPVLTHTPGEASPAHPPAEFVEPGPFDLAYVIFTSGSTGIPKGVMVSHANLANLVEAVADLVGMSADSSIPWHTTPSFDMSVTELFVPLARGASIVLCKPEISRDPQAMVSLIVEHRVSHVQASPTLWSALLRQDGIGDHIVRMTGGEPLPLATANAMAAGGESWNLYGPTETTVWSTAERLDPGASQVPIGVPLRNTQVAVVDEQLRPLPCGEIGELAIGGVGVSLGYWDNPELSDQRFCRADWTPAGSVVYRTGDRVRLSEDGRLIFLGRGDDQVKIHGYRVELGDIEHALEQDSLVEKAVIGLTDGQLYALVQPRETVQGRRENWQAPAVVRQTDDIDGSAVSDEVRRARIQALSVLVREAGDTIAICDGVGRGVGELSALLPGATVLSAGLPEGSSYDVIVVDGLDHLSPDWVSFRERCRDLLECLLPGGRLILTDLMSPQDHEMARFATSSYAGVRAPSRPTYLLVDPWRLAAELGVGVQARPRLEDSTLSDFRHDLVVSVDTLPHAQSRVPWQPQWGHSQDLRSALAGVPADAMVTGIPDRRLAPVLSAMAAGPQNAVEVLLRASATGFTPVELLAAAGPGWRIYRDGANLAMARQHVVPPHGEIANPGLLWAEEDPALADWSRRHLDLIRRNLANRLPAYMLPSRIRAVTRFPLTANGKIDRRVAAQVWETVQAPERSQDLPGAENLTLWGYWEQVARRYPQEPALDGPEGVLSHEALLVAAESLARRLVRAGVAAGTRVLIALPRGNDFIIALLAVSRLGGSFIPLDVTQPVSRIRLMAEDAGASCVLTSTQFSAVVEATGSVVIIDDAQAATETVAELPDMDATEVTSEAYVIFTSGSSGRPKGVRVSHRGLVTLLEAQRGRFATGPGTRVLQFAAVGFDALIWEISLSLLHGGCLVIRPRESLRPGPDLARVLTQERITDVVLQPSVLAVLPEDELPSSLNLVSAGEALTPALVNRYADRVRLFNAYGPTEFTVLSHLSEQLHPGEAPTIGDAAPGVLAEVLDEDLCPVAQGETGELVLSGRSLALGYLDPLGASAQAFISHPRYHGEGAYRTGDLVRADEHGKLLYVGRRDDQVKIRGVRVEPGEVESVLGSLPEVRYAAVVPVREGGQWHLEAFVVGGEAESVASALAERFPDAMLPRINPREQLPMNANGKVDRTALVKEATVRRERVADTPGSVGGRALGALVCREDAAAAAVTSIMVTDRHGREVGVRLWPVADQPASYLHADPADLAAAVRRAEEEQRGETDLTSLIRQIWQQVLARPVTDDRTDFFALGGHSLRAAEVVLRLRRVGHELTVADFFADPTVAGNARLLRGQRRQLTDAELVAAAQLDEGILPSAALPEDMRRSVNPQRIFLSGGTGFLGSRMILELLEHTDATLYCLVRGRDADDAEQRLRRAVSRFRSEAAQESLDGWPERVRVVPGDLAQPYLGLAPRVFDDLAQRIDVVFHLGASVNLLDSFDHMRAPNITGTTEMLRLASSRRVKPFHHVSTVAVVLGTAGRCQEIPESVEVSPSEVLRTGYVMTKWVAEQLVGQARDRGLPATIYRLTRVAQDRATGTANLQDAQLLFLKAAVEIGSWPDASPEFAASDNDAVPVDDIALWLRQLALSQDASGKAYHLGSPQPISLGEMADRMRSAGYRLRSVTLEQWSDELAEQAEKAETAAVRASSELRSMSASLPELGRYRISLSEAQRDLAAVNVVTSPLDGDLFEWHVRKLVEAGFIPAPPQPMETSDLGIATRHTAEKETNG